MPPPELLERAAPASVGALVLENLRAEVPMPRHNGPRADEAYLRAQIVETHAALDADAEREASITLARLLAARGRDLAMATKLARRALVIAEDAPLRVELAGWLAGLGDTAGAAATLREAVSMQPPEEAARSLVKIAVLLARGGDAAGAAEALDEAAGVDEADAMAIELFGTLAAWAKETVTPEGAAAAYLEAARRRAASGDEEAAFEDRVRAFDLAPHDAAAAEAMAEALTERGLGGAGDEVRRRHAIAAQAMSGQDPRPTHRKRMLSALRDGDAARAVGAVLDASLAGELSGDDAPKVDEALALGGLYELLALRLELRAEQQQGADRSETWQALAKLCAGPLASPDRAVEAWIEALASDPTSLAARTALRDHATALHDPAPLAEALLRVALARMEGEGAADPARVAALRELHALADDKLADPSLATFALDALGAAGVGADLVHADRVALTARVKRQDEELATGKRALEGAETTEARVTALRKIAAAHQGRPAEVADLIATLADLARAVPSERAVLTALERASRRAGSWDALEAVLRERLTGGAARVDMVRARLGLSAIARRRGSEEKALAEVLPVLVEAPGHRGAAGAALLLATRLGRRKECADALAQLAGPAWPALRAVLLSVASEILEAEGSAEAARRHAEHACEADPTCARAVSTLAALADRAAVARGDGVAATDRVGAAAIERAMTTVLPRSAWCERLSRSFEELGEPTLALAWTQRWLALRPGSGTAMELFLRRAKAEKEPARIADAIAWVLAQPRPLAGFAEALAAELFELLELDRMRARALARRTLDVLGPRVPLLRARLLDLGERATDPGLCIAVLERYIAAETLGPFAGDILLELSRRRTDAGDYDGAARELSRAALEGGNADAVLDHAGKLEGAMREAGAWLGSDGLCAIAEAKAHALAAQSGDGAKAAPTAFRELGSLRWDLGGDTRGAEEAFFRACELVPEGGVERYARDLCAFAGAHEAIDWLLARAEKATGDASRKLRANLLLEAAQLATEHGMPERALFAASSAIESDPARADAVAFVEKNAHVEGGLAVLDRTYDLLAGAALGRYGRRAAHYRGARQLERRGALDLALRHAALCFEAVPSEGTSYVLLTRLAERGGDPAEAVRAIERVAEAADPGARPVWLKRAAAVAGNGEEGLRTRFDLLLRALNVRPEPDTVAEVAAAARALTAIGGEGDSAPDMVRMRFERAVKASLPKLDGPDGARTGVEMARLAIELSAIPLAFAALTRAAAADGDVDEYATLGPVVPALAADAAAAEAWVSAVRTTADRPYSGIGPALLRLAGQTAHALGADATRAALLVLAVQRASDDDVILEEAHVAVAESGDAALSKRLDTLVSPEDRVAAWLRLAEAREREGREAEAIPALERALASGLLARDAQDRVSTRLQSLLDREGRDDDAEALLRSQLARPSLPPPAQARTARDLADVLLRRDDRRGAFEVLASLADQGPPRPDLLAELRGLARATGDLDRYAAVLASAASRAESDLARLEILRELAPLLTELGDHEQAGERYAEIARIDPADAQALEILERAANDRGDHATIAELLGRRIALTPVGDKKRMLRLRRAAVLEQRLGQLDDAARELTALLGEAPDDVSAMRFLADIHERRGAAKDAASLLDRLGRMAGSIDEQAEYGLRGAAAYLSAGEVERAETALEDIAAVAPREQVLELRVEIWRKRGDARALSEALEQLAASSREPADRRAHMLLDAARAASSLGDDATALDRARRALKLSPMLPDAVLEARRLEYRAGGTGTPREAQAAVDELARIETKIDPVQIELHAFLLAEALDAIQGGGAGMRELSRRHAEVGPLPLIALGMAERMVRAKSFEAALPLFDHALAGDLRGLRSRGRVALAAAEAASAAQIFPQAARLLDLAAAEPETQLVAQRRQLELAASLGDPDIARQALEELLRQSTGLDRARVLLSLGKLISAANPDRAARLFAEAVPLAAAEKSLSAQLTEASARLAAQRAQPDPEPPPMSARALRATAAAAAHETKPADTKPRDAAKPREPAKSPSNEAVKPASPEAAKPAETKPIEAKPTDGSKPADTGRPADVAKPADASKPAEAAKPVSLADPTKPPPLPGARTPSPPSVRAPQSVRLPVDDAPSAADETEEQRLRRELAHGSFEAGEELVAFYGKRTGDRSQQEIFAVRRQQAQILPGDTKVLDRLIEAAVADGNAMYARAVEHVRRALDRDPPPAPPLAAQRLAPDLVAALLFRSIADSAVHEALSLVLDTGLYRRDVGQYQLTGVARVQPGGGSMLGDVYGAVTRLFGQARTALFHQRNAAPAAFKIALLAPPAIVLTGEVKEETPELRYLLGAALAGATPEHALVNALSDDARGTLIDALHAAFGPALQLPKSDAAVARLGQNLWQLVPPRADRRLRELLMDPRSITREAALAGTRQAMRRAGLFASGSLAVTLAHIAPELSIPLDTFRAAEGGLAQMCAAHPEIADLVKLAVRMEYAEARWAPGAPVRRDTPPTSRRW
ncbi:Translation initiation factor 2 [Minicystis rosea]|nr:Translation initiation factor 2 [Minicystis rosea]